MQDIDRHLTDIADMRRMMDRSQRFVSLSGMAGVSAGVFALLGAAAAFYRMNSTGRGWGMRSYAYRNVFTLTDDTSTDLVIIAIAVLACALISATFFTYRKARRTDDSLINPASKRMMISMAIPLITGGAFCLLMMRLELYGLVAPATLIFYGLACLQAAHFTLSEIKYIGLFNIALGLINCYFIGYGLFFWAFGFGVLHIVYGALMHLRYDRAQTS